MINAVHTNPSDALSPVPAVQAGLGCKIGKQTPKYAGYEKAPAAQAFTTRTRALILDSLGKVEGESFAAYCIQLFVRNAHMKSDYDIRQMIAGLQDQINDNPGALKRILGSQYEFIKELRLAPEF